MNTLTRNAGALDGLGRHGEAEKLRARALAELQRILGPDHPAVREISSASLPRAGEK
jgi:hypothetical protein